VTQQGEFSDPEDLFKEAQRLTRWHYQWVVTHDFLSRIVSPDVLGSLNWPTDDPHDLRLRFFGWRYHPFMPVEFSAAAYRYGHSQIRGGYAINNVVRAPTFNPGHCRIGGRILGASGRYTLDGR
jgi:Animal haem peroxidase